MSALSRYILRPSAKVRDVYMGIGGLCLILAIIALAGSDFSFDPATKERLRPLSYILGSVGIIFWARGSVVPATNNKHTETN